MNVRARAKFIHMSPRKTRLVVDLVRGLPIDAARRQLLFSTKAAAKPILKALNSAVANATNNFGADASLLRVSTAFVDEGPTFFRYTPRAQGRATPIRKRMSHITIEVSDGLETVAEKEVVKEKVVKKATAPKKVVKKVTKKDAEAPKEDK